MTNDFDVWLGQARACKIEDEIARRGIALRGRVERTGPCPTCGGDDRFSINTSKQLWNCRGCGVGGDVIKLVEHLDGVDFIAACTTLVGEPPPQNGRDASEPLKIVTATFTYENTDGTTAFAVDRIEQLNWDGSRLIKNGKPVKSFRQKRPDPDRPGAWLHNVDGVPVVPYRLPEVLEAAGNGRTVLIVEGERKADLLWSWNVPATCNAGGAGKWRAEHSEFLRGAEVVLLPDNDDRGFKHVQKVGALLSGIANRVRVLVLPGLPPKGDIVDWAKGGSREALDQLIEQASDWQPTISDDATKVSVEKAKAKVKEDALLDALRRTPRGVEYDRLRKEAAKELNVSRSAIDDEIASRRDDEVASPLLGHWNVEPWPEPAEGDSLLRDIIRRIHRHVVCAHDAALAVALWIMFSWVHDTVATHSPILAVTSAEPESGKSTTLGLLSFLTPRCISSVAISEAALYRAIKLWQPSFAIDEFDTVLASDDASGLRAVINSGHVRGQGVIRCVGDDKTPELFPTFTPKALGMIGRKLPPATSSRCLFVELRRKRRDERVKRFEHEDDSELADLRRRLLRWSMDNEVPLRTKLASVAMPAELENRRADNWRVQLAIADLAGEDWGDKARAAAVGIESKSDTRTAGVRMLATIQALFNSLEDPLTDPVSSAALIDKLTTDPTSEWAEWGRGKPITQRQLATLLKPFQIFPERVQIGDRRVRGYCRQQFEDAWKTYIPLSGGDLSVQVPGDQ